MYLCTTVEQRAALEHEQKTNLTTVLPCYRACRDSILLTGVVWPHQCFRPQSHRRFLEKNLNVWGTATPTHRQLPTCSQQRMTLCLNVMLANQHHSVPKGNTTYCSPYCRTSLVITTISVIGDIDCSSHRKQHTSIINFHH